MQWCGGILCRCKLCSGVAAYYVKSIFVCMQCVVQNETAMLCVVGFVTYLPVRIAATPLHSLQRHIFTELLTISIQVLAP
jgi:hypothetical protein